MQTPTAPSSRYVLVDIVRGFALFGVLLANMVWTTQWFALTDAQRASIPTAELDAVLSFLTFMLVDFKFYTLFSMLFGLGFAMQLSRTSMSRQSHQRVYVRRLLILFFVGVAHAYLIWFGDILHAYAIVGFALMFAQYLSDKVILRLAACIALLTSLMPFSQAIGLTDSDVGLPVVGVLANPKFAALTSGDWSEVVRTNVSFMREQYGQLTIGFDSTVYLYLSVLWKFLVGFVIGRRMLLQNATEHVPEYRRILPWAAAVGIIGNAYVSGSYWLFGESLPDYSSIPMSLSWILVELSLFALSVAYLAGLIVLYQRDRWRRRLGLLAPVGRMALTNYLLQSAVIVFVFYGAGLNLLGKVGTSFCVILSVVAFGFQVVVSRWWLCRFRFGPAEWLWRCLTYGKRQPFRLTTTVTV